MTSQAVIDFVRTGIADDKSLETIAEEMCDNCLADDVMNGVGCDNMTVVICGLLGDKTVDEWKASIAANLIPGVKNTVEVVN
jgi:protein phosphatase PTC2/3